jgi:hypothetical protein
MGTQQFENGVKNNRGEALNARCKDNDLLISRFNIPP